MATTEISIPEEEAIEREGRLMAEVQNLRDHCADAVVDTRGLEMRLSMQDVVEATELRARTEQLPANDRVRIIARNGENLGLQLSERAHRQLSDRVGVPWSYYTRMLHSQPDLLAENVNRWMHAEPDTRLFRMVRPLNESENIRAAAIGARYRVRAVLGGGYRPTDNIELLTAILPVARAGGVRLRDYSLTDDKMHARWVGEEKTIEEVKAEYAAKYDLDPANVGRHIHVGGRDISWVDEVMRFGGFLRNSETGDGALEAGVFFDLLKCLNGYVASSERVIHVGRRRKADEDGSLSWLSSETQTLEAAALISRASDTMAKSLTVESRCRSAATVSDAAADEIETEGAGFFRFVDGVGAAFGLTQAELEGAKEAAGEVAAQEGYAGGLATRLPVSRFGVAQVFSALARETPEFERKVELERAGWEVVSGKASALFNEARREIRKEREAARSN